MRAAALVAALALLLVALPARAGDGDQLVIEGRTSWTIIGTGKNATGGFTPQAAATYLFSLGSGAGLGLGADIGVFGFGGGSRWIGVLGGPTARFALKAGSSPLDLSLTIAADFGRIPVCTPWEHPICPRFVGLFPSAAVSGSYVFDSGVMLGAKFSMRVVNTLIGVSASYEPGLVIGLLLNRK